MANLFDGPGGALVAKIMARWNADAEAEAIGLLDPPPTASVLVIGFGAGVGVALLADRLTDGMVVGVDPSHAMMREAGRRNRDAIAAGRVKLEKTTAEGLSAPQAHFDGAIAVNALQFCEPIEPTALTLARVMRGGARLVTLTHGWALARHAGSVEAWVRRAGDALAGAGFIDIRTFAAKAEKGGAIALTARKDVNRD